MSFSSSDDDSQQRFALGFLFALIALVVSTVVGVVVYKRGIAHAPTAPAATAAGAIGAGAAAAPGSVVVVDDAATVVVEGGVVKFYFATGRSDLAPGAAQALQQAVAAAKGGAHLRVSGYHDATGSAAKNAELAKQRALAVRQALLDQGVPEGNIELVKPAELVGATDPSEARRVDVIVIKSGQ